MRLLWSTLHFVIFCLTLYCAVNWIQTNGHSIWLVAVAGGLYGLLSGIVADWIKGRIK